MMLEGDELLIDWSLHVDSREKLVLLEDNYAVTLDAAGTAVLELLTIGSFEYALSLSSMEGGC